MASDTLVSARIAKGKKESAKRVLDSLGTTTSDLINSAFDYLLEMGELPQAQMPEKKTISDFRQFMEASTIPVDWGSDASDGDYRKLIRASKRESYESLA